MSGNRSKSTFFEGGGKGASLTNHSWYPSSRVIALSCGIKLSAVRHLVLSQSTRVTDGQTDRQNYDSQERPRICWRGKNHIKTDLNWNKRLVLYFLSFFVCVNIFQRKEMIFVALPVALPQLFCRRTATVLID